MIFEPLERDSIHKIIDLELSHLVDRVKHMGYQITISGNAKDFIVEKGWDAQFGARPLKRAIQKYIEDELAEAIITSKLHWGDLINVDYIESDEKPTITTVSLNDETKSAT
ncbi:MAG TPA: hypothetical protein VLH16_00745 [Bacteroidales bacterium]|nr:hypothetical protein [Bacteroidales bacterium]